MRCRVALDLWLLVCLVRRHAWRDPSRPRRFTVIPVRVCARCGRVESKFYTGKWHRFKDKEGEILP
jgi:hypothetical protein